MRICKCGTKYSNALDKCPVCEPKAVFKHLVFKVNENTLRSDYQSWYVYGYRKANLGEIHYYTPWKEYVFYPLDGTFFSAGCQRDIAQFMTWQNQG
ncbi:hypothetical protein MUP59_00945 [Candidatus Bathyarchaeota archaeon]|nr:hypothetical protein [Candidatus Bathyarchaeota archaeon]